MFFYQRIVPGLAIASYLIADMKTLKGVVIDPVRDVDEYLDVAEKNQITITDIVETHVHADFICGSKELKHRLNGKPTIHCSGMGGEAWNPKYADHLVQTGDQVILGTIRLRAVHTPGHTPEHIMWELYDDSENKETPLMLFTGDFVFVGDVGRPDLLGKEEQRKLIHQLYSSVFDILPHYPDSVQLYPAHVSGSMCGKAIGADKSTTLGNERRFNPSLQEMAEDAWCNQLMNLMPSAPPYFKVMKQVNVMGPELIKNPVDRLKAYTVEELAHIDPSKVIILDTRSKEAFSVSHITGSYNVPFGPNLPTYAGCVLPYDKAIVLVCEENSSIPKVVSLLLSVGYDNVKGFLDGGISKWEEAGKSVSYIETVNPQELLKRLKGNNPPLVVDVRSIGEWTSGHINGAIHMPITAILDHLAEIPNDRPLATVCKSGYRASVVASILKNRGFGDVSSVTGGMEAWEKENLPVI